MDKRFDVSVEVLLSDELAVGERARHNVEKIGAEALARYIEGSIHYGDDFQDETGLKGQWCDIKRKVGPLKRALWDEEILTRESPREICLDLIGHLLMTIDMLDRLSQSEAIESDRMAQESGRATLRISAAGKAAADAFRTHRSQKPTPPDDDDESF